MVGGVRQVGAFRLHDVDELQRLLQIEVGVVLLKVQGIDNQHLKSLKAGHFGLRHEARVCDVGERSDTVAEYGQSEVANLYRLDLHTADRELVAADGMQLEGRRTGIGMLLKGVVEVLADDVQHARHRIDVHGPLLPEIDGPDVVQTRQVVLVLVGDENGIHSGDILAQELLPQVRTGIDEQIHPIHLHESRSTQPVVTRVGGTAHLALASHHGNALRSACA